LLEVYPRRVTVLKAADASQVIPTIRDLLAFLGDTERIPAREIRRLEHEVDRIEPRFLDAVMDRANWGPARSLMQGMTADGVDFSDQSAVDRWISAYNADLTPGLQGLQDDGEDFDFQEAFGLPDRLPPLRLPPESDLEASARESRLLCRAHELAVWVGDRRGITDDGELAPAEAIEAARALGIPIPERDPQAEGVLPGMSAKPAIKGMRDLPDLVHLWRLAGDVDFIEFSADHVTVGEGIADWADGDEDDVLELWQTALANTLNHALVMDADPDGRHQLDFDGVGGIVVVALFLARSMGLPPAELREMIRETATAELLPVPARKAWQSWTKAHGDPADTLLAHLQDLGAVELGGDVARLTPLGMWAVRDQLREGGVQVPLLPPVEKMTAEDLVAAAVGSSEEELAAETTAWLGRRSPEEAARQLLEVAAAGGPADRMYATAIVTELGAITEPQWREALNHLELRPYAKMALARIAGTEPEETAPGLEPEPEDVGWLLTDVLAATSDALGPDELVGELHQAVPPGQEQSVFEVMWRLPHPNAHEVLTMLGEYHPDKKIAKAARKAAFKASSRP
jgi:hypothetical protein